MNKPRIEGAPGLAWKPRKHGRWEARWQARTDIVIEKGFQPKSIRVWCGTEAELNEIVQDFIRSRCAIMQNEMLVFNAGGVPTIEATFDGTLRSLIAMYQIDPMSTYHKLRYNSRRTSNALTKRIEERHGNTFIETIKARTLIEWHQQWADAGKVAMGHAMISQIRTLLTFGATLLDNDDCRRVRQILRDMKFKMSKPREERLTSEQADMIRAAAHEKGRHSIALAQAFQFECMLRQKDVIGEWVPISELGPATEVVDGNSKWFRGLRWSEIDDNLILRHMTSKRQKMIEIDLKGAPMVMDELARLRALYGNLPANGPVIVSERTKAPYDMISFRRMWRELATKCGIPKEVRNMDSRAGAISEATDAGADLEHVRHAATHSDIAMTQRYSRNSAGKVAEVQVLRSAHRNKPKT